MATGVGLLGVGLFVGIVGVVLCFLFPVVGGIVIAIGACMVVGGATIWGVYQNKINKVNSDILELNILELKNKIGMIGLWRFNQTAYIKIEFESRCLRIE